MTLRRPRLPYLVGKFQLKTEPNNPFPDVEIIPTQPKLPVGIVAMMISV